MKSNVSLKAFKLKDRNMVVYLSKSVLCSLRSFIYLIQECILFYKIVYRSPKCQLENGKLLSYKMHSRIKFLK